MNKAFEECLLEAVKKYPLLYDRNNRSFHNKIKRKRAWIEVAKEVGASIEDCQNRWKTLRDRFVKEICKTPGREKWRFYEAMLFLKNCIKPRQNTIKTDFSETTFDEVIMPSPPMSNTSHFLSETSVNHNIISPDTSIVEDIDVPPAKRQRDDLSSIRENTSSILGIVHEFVENSKPDGSNRRNKNSDFFSMLDGYLVKLNDDDRDIIKLEILNFTHKRSLELRNATNIAYEYSTTGI